MHLSSINVMYTIYFFYSVIIGNSKKLTEYKLIFGVIHYKLLIHNSQQFINTFLEHRPGWMKI